MSHNDLVTARAGSPKAEPVSSAEVRIRSPDPTNTEIPSGKLSPSPEIVHASIVTAAVEDARRNSINNNSSSGNNVDEGNNSHVGSSAPIPSALLSRNLWFFIWLKAIGSFDSGAFSAALGAGNGIAENWMLTTVEQGTLTSSVFLGNVLGCPLAGHLFSQYDEKTVFGYSLLFHMVFTVLFGVFPEYYMALFNRFFIGLTLAFIVVYTPVWVDEFAPKTRQSMWQAFQNAGVPLGIMFGYILGAFFPTYTTWGWELSFYIKALLMLPTLLYLWKVDKRSINTRSRRSTAAAILEEHPPHLVDSSAVADHVTTSAGGTPVVSGAPSGAALRHRWLPSLRLRIKGFFAAMRQLTGNVVYMCSTFSMCCLYFAATGLQNFVTQYLRGEPFNASMQTIMVGFGVAVVTAPVCGVVAGGILLDRIGGYSSDFLRTTLFALVCGLFGGTCAIVCIFVQTTGTFLLVMSVLLFCGGAIIPPGIGLTMASLPSTRRSAGAAFSQTVYNLLGNFSGPLVCGYVAEWTGELRWGITTVLLSSVLGILPLIVIVFVAKFYPHRMTANAQQQRSGRSIPSQHSQPDGTTTTSTTNSPQPPQMGTVGRRAKMLAHRHHSADCGDDGRTVSVVIESLESDYNADEAAERGGGSAAFESRRLSTGGEDVMDRTMTVMRCESLVVPGIGGGALQRDETLSGAAMLSEPTSATTMDKTTSPSGALPLGRAYSSSPAGGLQKPTVGGNSAPNPARTGPTLTEVLDLPQPVATAAELRAGETSSSSASYFPHHSATLGGGSAVIIAPVLSTTTTTTTTSGAGVGSPSGGIAAEMLPSAGAMAADSSASARLTGRRTSLTLSANLRQPANAVGAAVPVGLEDERSGGRVTQAQNMDEAAALSRLASSHPRRSTMATNTRRGSTRLGPSYSSGSFTAEAGVPASRRSGRLSHAGGSGTFYMNEAVQRANSNAMDWNETFSLPNQHNFGMDVVRSLLVTQPSFVVDNEEEVEESEEESEDESEEGEQQQPQ